MSRTERMYKMLYKNNGYTVNLSSINVVLENKKEASGHELDVMVNEEFINLKFDSLLDKTLFYKSLRENVIGEFYKFEDIGINIMDTYISTSNRNRVPAPDPFRSTNSFVRRLDGDFIINIYTIDVYKYTDFANSLYIEIGDKELMLINIGKDEYEKFDKFMIDNIGLSK